MSNRVSRNGCRVSGCGCLIGCLRCRVSGVGYLIWFRVSRVRSGFGYRVSDVGSAFLDPDHPSKLNCDHEELNPETCHPLPVTRYPITRYPIPDTRNPKPDTRHLFSKMKRCPSCNRTYTELSLNFCLEDGTPLLLNAAPRPAPTERYASPRNTNEPPPTEIYPHGAPLLNQVPEMTPPRAAPHWSPPAQMHPVKKSNAVWWVVGGLAVVGVLGVVLVVIILALASMDTNENNSNGNSNSVVVNNNRSANDTSPNTNNLNSDLSNSNLQSAGSADRRFRVRKMAHRNVSIRRYLVRR